MLNFLRNHYIVFQNSCTILHSQQQCTKVPISSHLCQPLLFPFFFFFCVITVSIGVKWSLTVVLFCIFLMTSDAEHLFKSLLAICISFLKKCLFKFLAHFLKIFIYLFMAVLGLRFCARAFSSCGKWGPLFIAVCGPLTIAASLVAEHRLQTRRLSNCGSQAQSLRGMWDLPRPGLEPVSPALAGRLSTTAPPGKPHCTLLNWVFLLLSVGVLYIFWKLSLNRYDLQIFSLIPWAVFSLSWWCSFMHKSLEFQLMKFNLSIFFFSSLYFGVIFKKLSPNPVWWKLLSVFSSKSLKKIFILYWDLQCCISFRCTAKWFIYTYIYIFFFRFFSHLGYYRILSRVACAI